MMVDGGWWMVAGGWWNSETLIENNFQHVYPAKSKKSIYCRRKRRATDKEEAKLLMGNKV